jgi:hypothetical protein
MKDLSYQNLFGDKKRVNHEDALKERVIGIIVDIIADENKVSEKSFNKYDEIIKTVNNSYSEEMFNISNQMYNEGKRLKYISEYLYDKYFKMNALKENTIIKFTNFINESKKSGYDYGCMMLYVKLEGIEDIHSKIDKKDLYTDDNDDSYGIEKETHITIKYGFKEDVSDHEVLDICRKSKFGDIKFNKISLFENDKFDVLKFDIKSKVLNELNEKISKFPNEDKYPEYNAHSTIAYIKKGKGKKYVDMFKDIDLIGNADKLVYSNPDNTKLSLIIN